MAWEITEDDDQLEAKRAAELAEIERLQQQAAAELEKTPADRA